MNVGNKLAILFVTISVIALGISAFYISGQDKEPPVISFSENKVVYEEGMDTSELLKGVEAKDAEDGDVTAQVVVEKITKTSSGKSVIVTYAAGDRHNNFVKASRVFQAKTDGKNAKQSDSKTTTNGNEELPADTADITAAADITNSMEKTENKAEAETAGNTENPNTDEAAANGEEANADETAANEEQAANSTENMLKAELPSLTLNTTEAVIKKGAFFNINDYIAELSDNVDSVETLQHRIRTNGEFDNHTVGDYPVTVFVIDSDGYASASQNLMIHVVE